MVDRDVAPSDDDVLVTKWLLLGGALWDCWGARNLGDPSTYRWYAIERGCNEDSLCASRNGHTPTHAILRYLEAFEREKDHEWLAPLLEYVRSTTSSDLGPTPPHTAM